LEALRQAKTICHWGSAAIKLAVANPIPTFAPVITTALMHSLLFAQPS